MKILFVEDNVYANALAELLKKEGHEVVEANDILEAHCYINIEPKIDYFDIIFIDLNLPYPPENILEVIELEVKSDLSGWDYISQEIFKKYPEYKNKIIIYSAYSQRLRKIAGEDIFLSLNIVDKSSYDIVEKAKRLISEIKERS